MTACICCGDKHATPLVLCPMCEWKAQEFRRKAGLPIRGEQAV